MKSVLLSIQPYWVFLIIAKSMGWNINKAKIIEVRKSYPKDENWDKVIKIYCSKDKKSFAKIPKEYQPLMRQYLGKVIGEFVCDKIDEIRVVDTELMRYVTVNDKADMFISEETCLSIDALYDYLWHQKGYGFHISGLIIYDKPKELSEFRSYNTRAYVDENGYPMPTHEITRPFQSWGYVYETDT